MAEGTAEQVRRTEDELPLTLVAGVLGLIALLAAFLHCRKYVVACWDLKFVKDASVGDEEPTAAVTAVFEAWLPRLRVDSELPCDVGWHNVLLPEIEGASRGVDEPDPVDAQGAANDTVADDD